MKSEQTLQKANRSEQIRFSPLHWHLRLSNFDSSYKTNQTNAGIIHVHFEQTFSKSVLKQYFQYCKHSMYHCNVKWIQIQTDLPKALSFECKN